MSESTPVKIHVDVTNPGHYFACCGLLELAARLAPEAMGWFEKDFFRISKGPSLAEVVGKLTVSEFKKVDHNDATASPILITGPFNLQLNWWKNTDRKMSGLKLWAGRMESFRIAKAMQDAMKSPEFISDDILNVSKVAYDPDFPDNKVEPFYFDSRRGPNSHSRDVGFSTDALGVTTIASPATELLCLIGLQRVKPIPTSKPRLYDYHTWKAPLPALLAPVAAAGLLPDPEAKGYRFECWFRTSQRKHKAFLSAKLKPTNQTP